jgi:hypothetical protein
VAGTRASAYPTPVDFDGSVTRWPVGPEDPPITYKIEAASAQDLSVYAGIVEDAASLWSEIPESYFKYAAATDDETPQVTLHLDHAIDGGDYSAGYTIFDEYDGTKPKHCSIFVQLSGASYGSIGKTVLHELGHCVGLGHSLIPQAIMSYSLEKNSFALDLDDEAATSRLYPASGHAARLPPGCAMGAARAGQTAPWLVLAALFAPLVAAAGYARVNGTRASDRSRP